jgi:hypothetical protein
MTTLPNKSTDTQCSKAMKGEPVKYPPVTPDRFFRAFDNGIANGGSRQFAQQPVVPEDGVY